MSSTNESKATSAIQVCESLSDIIRIVSNTSLPGEGTEGPLWPIELWFRGHSDKTYDLEPTMLRGTWREWARNNIPFSSDDTDNDATLRSVEKQLLSEFQRRTAAISSSPRRCVEQYVLARHHGLPTRLLDWSQNLLTALWFTVNPRNGGDEKDGHLIAVIPSWKLCGIDKGERLQREKRPPKHVPCYEYSEYTEEAVKWLLGDEDQGPFQELIIPFYANYSNARTKRQSSCFTLHMPGSRWNLSSENHFKIEIPCASKRRIRQELQICGLTGAELFGNLDNLCESLVTALKDGCSP